jgi:hypothetical protein
MVIRMMLEKRKGSAFYPPRRGILPQNMGLIRF